MANEIIISKDTRPYKSLITDIGNAKMTLAVLEGRKVNIVEMRLGDGGGAYYMPTSEATSLVNEVWAGEIASKSINEASPNIIAVKTVIPTSAPDHRRGTPSTGPSTAPAGRPPAPSSPSRGHTTSTGPGSTWSGPTAPSSGANRTPISPRRIIRRRGRRPPQSRRSAPRETPAMSNTELVAELTDICIRQAEIIKAQAFIIEQFGAQIREEEALAERNRLRELVGDRVV